MVQLFLMWLDQVIRDLELLPQLLGQDWSSVFLQRFDGTVTYVSFYLKHRNQFQLKVVYFQNMAKDSSLGMYLFFVQS